MRKLKLFSNPDMPARRHWLWSGIAAAIAAVAVALDQWTKWLVVTLMAMDDTIPLWEGVFHITRVKPNPGAAFGIFSAPEQRWIFMVISSVAIVGISIYLCLDRSVPPLGRVALALIVGGGIGNMIDRFAEGAVVDFLDFRLINFAVFNVADSFVCIGAGLMVIALILTVVQEVKQEKQEDEGQ